METAKILILEHDRADIDLLHRELKNGKIDYEGREIQTETAFIEALNEFSPDLILADYSLPQFCGLAAFNIKQKVKPLIPFIMVSGTVGEERAVELIKSGVTDYVLKDRLISLPAKILRALNEARQHAEKIKTEQEIVKLNAELEQRVITRTAQLTEANKALEAFSYSVSHDLRAPIRTILGFTTIIQKEHTAGFNSEVTDLFNYIVKNAKRMNAIIEDLLLLSKCEKEKLHCTPVDLGNLFSTVWQNLLVSTPHQAKLELLPLPIVQADRSLIEQVVVNLVSNAIKYSAKKENATVTIGCEQSASSVTFYIKDNGAGFDMKNYDLLFNAFQRLHGNSEFEGTGVGLALVKRIVERHGGLVWAEAAVNKGATFYFSLPVCNRV